MIDIDTLPMRVGLGQFQEITDQRLAYIKQCGCDDFQMNIPDLPGEERWEYEDLAGLVERASAAELRLMSIENVPPRFYDKIMLGQQGREQQLDNMVYTIQNLAKQEFPYWDITSCPEASGELPTILRYAVARWQPHLTTKKPAMFGQETGPTSGSGPQYKLTGNTAKKKSGTTTVGTWNAYCPCVSKPVYDLHYTRTTRLCHP